MWNICANKSAIVTASHLDILISYTFDQPVKTFTYYKIIMTAQQRRAGHPSASIGHRILNFQEGKNYEKFVLKSAISKIFSFDTVETFFYLKSKK